MASDANLQIRISADSKDLQKEIAKARGQLDRFENTAKKAGKGVGNVGKQIAGNVTPSVIEFNRVIQDAPFGIQGVGNNLQQLSQTFGRLRAETGSTGKALIGVAKGMVSGPFALITVVTLATTALTLLAKSKQGVTEETNKLVDATKDLVGSANAEITVYQSLLSIARDNAKSIEDRRKALDKVNEISGKYVGNLKLENINSTAATTATDKYTQALIRNAKIKGLQNRISEIFAKQAEIEGKAVEENLTFWDNFGITLKKVGESWGFYNSKQEKARIGTERQGEALKEGNAEIDRLTVALNKLLNEDISLDGIFTGTKDGGKGDNKLIRSFIAPLESALPQVTLLSQAINEQFTKITPSVEQRQRAVQDLGILFQTLKETAGQSLTDIQELAQSFAESTNNLIGGAISDTFSRLGSAIGEAVASGGNVFEAVGLALLDSIGNFLSQFGKLMLQYGVALKAYSIASKAALNPLTAGPAAVGLIAAGAALTLIGNAIGGLVSGSSSGGGSFNSSGGTRRDFSGSSTNFGSGGFGGGSRVVFEIAGTKLVGVISNTLRRDAALGGSLKLTN